MIGARVKVNINMGSILALTKKEIRKIIVRDSYQVAETFFKRAKAKMLKDYDKNPITLEIKAGPRALDTSGATDGYGNLFSFLGFYYGDKPTERLKDVLNFSTELSKKPIIKDNVATFTVKIPGKDEIDSVTELPWTAQSWREIVENGAENLTSYLYTKRKSYDTSISTKGFQLKYELNDDLQFKTDPFVTKILKDFRDSINKKENINYY